MPIGTVTDATSGLTHRGIIVGGVPIGSNVFVRIKLHEKATEIVEYIDATVERLSEHPHALWAALYYCCQSRFDYWLRHVAPYFTTGPAGLIDDALMRAVTVLTYQGCADDPLTRRRLRLPARLRGCGLRDRRKLAPVAFAACFIEAAEQMIDRSSLPGGPKDLRGYFPQLAPVFGADAFDPGGHRLRDFCQTDLDTAGELGEAWDDMLMVVLGSGVTGPLDLPLHDAGRNSGGHLQRQFTEHLEKIERNKLHRDIQLLPRTDTRRIAWLAVDRLSSQWVSAWPTHQTELSRDEMPEVMTTYLGRESAGADAAAAA